jgi:hypothetical protein
MPQAGDVARCQWHGTDFTAEYTGRDEDGRHIMKARENLPRFTAGTEIAVHPTLEIKEWLVAPPPPEPPKFIEEKA